MKKTKIYKIAGVTIKISVIVLTLLFLYREIFYKKDIAVVISFFKETSFTKVDISLFIVVIVMMFLNWSLEINKWRLLISKLQKVTFFNACIGVFSGITVSSFTPNRTGEYAGRVFVLESHNRWRGVFLTMVGSISQLTSTLVFGIIALLFFLPFFYLSTQHSMIIYPFLILSLGCIVFFYLNIGLVFKVLKRIKIPYKFIKYLIILKSLNLLLLIKVLVYSLLRHIVFSSQLYVLFVIFKLPISYFESLMVSAVVFLIITSIPTIALTELGVRGAVSIYVFGIFFNNTVYNLEILILTSTFFLWFINLAVPALIGTLLLNKLKIFKTH